MQNVGNGEQPFMPAGVSKTEISMTNTTRLDNRFFSGELVSDNSMIMDDQNADIVSNNNLMMEQYPTSMARDQNTSALE